MITLQLRFVDNREEYIAVDSAEFNTDTHELLIGVDGVHYGISVDCTVFVWIGSVMANRYSVTGRSNAAK